MVLENATEPTSTFSSDYDSPTSSPDPYSSDTPNAPIGDGNYIRIDQPSTPPIFVNISDVPHPLFVPANALYARTIQKTLNQNVSMGTQVLNRPVRQEEVEAFAWHLGKALRLGSYGTPMGVAVGTLMAYRSRGKHVRFPGWTAMKEGSRFSIDKFGPLRGQMARGAWSAGRMAAYWTFGAFLGQVFFGSYAITTSIAGRMGDPRLKEFLEALKKRQQEGQRLPRPSEVQRQGAPGVDQGETVQMGRQRREVQRQAERREQAQGSGGGEVGRGNDDMSPTGGAFQADLMQGPADTGLMSDAQAKPDYGRGQVPANSSSRMTEDAPRRRPEQNNSRGSGSSWDRLRKDAMSGNQNQSSAPNTSSKDSPSGNDSFSFSQGEEDKQLARSEAQKEFDQRMERERQGQDFDDGRSGRRKW